MLEDFIRPLSSAELRLIEIAIRSVTDRAGRFLLKLIAASSVVCVALWALTMLVSDTSPMTITIVWVGIAAVISAWGYLTEKPRMLSRTAKLQSALLHNKAHVVRIRSHRMIEFEEREDEGGCYAFELEGGRIVFLRGQDFYSSPKFPSTDFSIVEILDRDGAAVEIVIQKDGRKLKPFRTISKGKKPKVLPGNLQIVEGSLDHFEEASESRGGRS